MIRFSSILRVAFRALRRNKLRSLLTALGIIIGVAAVIAMVSIGNGARAQVEAQIASLGDNLIMVFWGGTTTQGVRPGWGSPRLTLGDGQSILREVKNIVTLSPEVQGQAQVVANNQNWFTHIYGESDTYFDLRNWPISEGAGFTAEDIQRLSKVCVVGQTIARELFSNQSALGQVIRIGNVPCTIIGVLSPRGFSVSGNDQDDLVVLPYSSAMKRVLGQAFFRQLNIKMEHSVDPEVGKEQIVEILRQRFHVRPGNEDPFTVRTQEDIAAAATATTRVMSLLLGSIAGVSLLVGGIGIMNIMLVSVTERTREIGTRMAVGAHGRDILLQFLMEAVALSSMGGVVGILLGLAISNILATTAGWPVLVSPSSIVVSFFFSAAVGVFFGFYPARAASQLDPIEALRYE